MAILSSNSSAGCLHAVIDCLTSGNHKKLVRTGKRVEEEGWTTQKCSELGGHEHRASMEVEPMWTSLT